MECDFSFYEQENPGVGKSSSVSHWPRYDKAPQAVGDCWQGSSVPVAILSYEERTGGCLWELTSHTLSSTGFLTFS